MLLWISDYISTTFCRCKYCIQQCINVDQDPALLQYGTIMSFQLVKSRREEGLLKRPKASLGEFSLCSVPQLLMNKRFSSIEMQNWKESKETFNLFIPFSQPWQ